MSNDVRYCRDYRSEYEHVCTATQKSACAHKQPELLSAAILCAEL